MILPALWSYIGAVAVKVDKLILRVNFDVATRAYNLLELWGYGVTAELS